MKIILSFQPKTSSLQPPASSLLLFLFILLWSSNIAFAAASTPLTIYTVNYPLAYFAERIGGDHVQVVLPVPEDVDPAFWEPDEVTVRQFQKADLIILNGAGYAKWTRKVSLPMLRMIDTSRAFKENLIKIETNVTHTHGPGGDHSHGGTAFTTWLDFSQASMQAEAIYNALILKLPTPKEYFTKNFEELKRELLELDNQMKAIGERLVQAPLFASHPIYQYLARRYNMNIRMIMWEPDEEPDGNEWKYLQEITKEHPARWMIWEDEPLPASVGKLQDMEIGSLVFTPCMNRPETGDFMEVMRRNTENLQNLF
ncbi:metal ABC transporter substrate-binding protein [Thermodesulfobacteriota bacterium]